MWPLAMDGQVEGWTNKSLEVSLRLILRTRDSTFMLNPFLLIFCWSFESGSSLETCLIQWFNLFDSMMMYIFTIILNIQFRTYFYLPVLISGQFFSPVYQTISPRKTCFAWVRQFQPDARRIIFLSNNIWTWVRLSITHNFFRIDNLYFCYSN